VDFQGRLISLWLPLWASRHHSLSFRDRHSGVENARSSDQAGTELGEEEAAAEGADGIQRSPGADHPLGDWTSAFLAAKNTLKSDNFMMMG
jgi:hypothetical protein